METNKDLGLELKRRQAAVAAETARKVLKKGDRVRCAKCPGGVNRTFTFERWEGDRMVSKSGIADFFPICVTKVNGARVDFLCRLKTEN